MASLSVGKAGTRISFCDGDNRRTIRLGSAKRSIGELVKRHVDAILTARRFGVALDSSTAAWLGSIDDTLYAKLAGAGLLLPRMNSTVGDYIDKLIASRTDLKPASIVCDKAARGRLIGYFGAEKSLGSFTEADAERWLQWITTERKPKLSRATIGRTVRHAKYFFDAAVKDGFLESNPFTDLKSFQQVNADRLAFVSRDVIDKVIAACPSNEMRLIIALARYGGLRCPSEHQALTWGDIKWDIGKFWVTSPKTEHHQNGAGRWVPIFPTLRPYLDQAFADAEDGAVHVVRNRTAGANWRTQLLRVINAAGLTPWPRLFQNLRASRETELAGEYPLHVAAAWIGNSAIVAVKHYLQVREEDFSRASGADESNIQPQQASA